MGETTPLKPCPYCGELPNAETLGEDCYYIVCGNVNCQSMDALSPEAWNTRPIEDSLQEQTRDLRVRLGVEIAKVARLEAELAASEGRLKTANQYTNDWADATVRLAKEREDIEKFHPRAVKLLTKLKPFVVVAEDEPYYIDVYRTIRSHETVKGTWTDEDEQQYKSAFKRWHDQQFWERR